jgi:hypothetical protein
MKHVRSTGGIFLPAAALAVGGVFTLEHKRDGETLSIDTFDNLVVNEGLDSILNTVFHGGTQIATWYLGLFEGNYAPVGAVTAGTIVANSTECTAYDEATRPEFVESASTGQSVTNSASKATFTINAAKTIYGAFLVSNSAKSATTGTLMSAARFPSSKVVAVADQMLLTYTFGAASV